METTVFDKMSKKGDASDKEVQDKQGSSRTPECAVCLQNCIHPARLPCSHVFCFLCVKGVANQSKKCPLCRTEIPSDFSEKPQLVDYEEISKENEEYQWFYEGRNGWWKYDSRTNEDLETFYKLGEAQCEILLCGTIYVIDFQNESQYNKFQPFRKRRIKRDKEHLPCNGIAGISSLS